MPPISFSKVVFPVPLGPMMAVTRPLGTCRVISLNICFVPREKLRPSISMKAGLSDMPGPVLIHGMVFLPDNPSGNLEMENHAICGDYFDLGARVDVRTGDAPGAVIHLDFADPVDHGLVQREHSSHVLLGALIQ